MSKKFNLKTYEKINGDEHIDMRLEESRGDVPDVINEKQLEDYRADEVEGITEKQLEKNRTGEEDQTTEARLNTQKSKFATKYRNAEAYEGDINKIEEQRLNGDPVEYEKYESASSTPKQLRWWEEKSPDGLKIAKKEETIKTAARNDDDEGLLDLSKDRWENIPETEDISDIGKDLPQIDEQDFAIRQVPAGESGVGQMTILKQKDLPNKDPEFSGIYYVLSYDPEAYGGNEDEIKQDAINKIVGERPELSGAIGLDEMSVDESTGEGKVSVRAIGPAIDAAIKGQSKSKGGEIGGRMGSQPYMEKSYEEKDAGDGTVMAIGRVMVNPDIDITFENKEEIISGALQYIQDKHPELEIDRESLDLSTLETVGKIGYMVAAPMGGVGGEQVVTKPENIIDVPEIINASSDFDIVVADSKKK